MGRETEKGKSRMKSVKHWVEPAEGGGWAVRNDEEILGVMTSEDAARTLAESFNYLCGDNQFSVYSRGRWNKEQAA